MTNTAYRKQVRDAMKWWRSVNPQFSKAKIVQTGIGGRCISARNSDERVIVANFDDVLDSYRAKVRS